MYRMSDLDKVKNWLLVRRLALWLLVGLIVFVGVAFIWKNGIVWAYDVWKPILSFLANISGRVWLICGVVFLVWKGLRYHFKESPSKKKLIIDNAISYSDAPIQKASDDLFARSAFVRMLGALTMRPSPDVGATYIGIYGGWGTGKTSVRNMLEEHVKSEYGEGGACFLEFNPWRYPAGFDVRTTFFEKIARKVEKSGDDELSRVFSQLAKLMALHRVDKDVGPIHDLVDGLRRLWFAWLLTEESLFDAAKTLLQESKRKIIVVLDDIDRLSKEEICQLVRFLKTNGDLPNLTYLILADETYLANAVSELVKRDDQGDLKTGREYLEKIIPIKCTLPILNNNTVLEHFKTGVGQLLKLYEINVSNQYDGVDFVATYLTSPRQAKRILNAFSIELATLRRKINGHLYLNVHIGDLLVLTTLKTCEPDLYPHILDVYYGLLHNSWRYYGDDKGLPKDWLHEHFFKYASPDKHDILMRFLDERLGVASDDSHGNSKSLYRLRRPNSQELLLNYRMASQFCILNYFFMDSGEMPVQQDDFESFMKSIRQGDIPEALLKRMDGEGRLPYLLYALEAMKPLENEVASLCYIKTLVRMANWTLTPATLPPEYQSWITEFNVYTYAYRCFLFYCSEINKSILGGVKVFDRRIARIGELLLPVLTSEHDVVMSARLIGHEHGLHSDGDQISSFDALFSNEDYESLKRGYLERIEQFMKEDFLVAHQDFFELFRCWRILLREYNDDMLYAKFRDVCLTYISDVGALNKLLVFFADDNRISSVNGELHVMARVDDLFRSFGEDGVANIMSTLESATCLTDYLFRFFTTLRWAISEKKADRPYDSTVQEKFLKERLQDEDFKREMANKVIRE